jgi:AcrR family transcriptional regulator
MAASGWVRTRRPGVPGPKGGGVYVSEFQRARLLDATAAVVSEQGYKRMTVRRVAERAGVSSKTFYDLFEDREDCFLAAFSLAVDQLAAVALPVWEVEREWSERVRAALAALLDYLDREHALCMLVFVEALGAGPRVLKQRARVLETLRHAIDQGRAGVRAGRELAPLTAEGVVGAAFSVIHARLLQEQHDSLTGLLGPLMATIVLPYRGHAAATRELTRPAPKADGGSSSGVSVRRSAEPMGDPLARTDFRPTLRTHAVLTAVAELGGRGSNPNNREVADAAQVSDQGQISRLLARLENLELLQNTGGQTQGLPKAWQLTPRGEEIVHAGQNVPSLPHKRGALPSVPEEEML